MSEVIEERCSCGASIRATGTPYRNDKNPNNPRGVEEIVERWRSDHRHETPTAAEIRERKNDD